MEQHERVVKEGGGSIDQWKPSGGDASDVGGGARIEQEDLWRE
jgi:hypothetical protein